MTIGSTATPEVVIPRAAWIEQIGAIDLPTKRDEAWRYAPHSELARLTFGPPPAVTPEVTEEIVEQIPTLDGPRIVIVNGVVDLGRSDLTSLPDGVHLASLADASADDPDLLAAHFGSDDGEPADAYVALNRAFGGGGALVHVADGHEIDTPIHIVDVALPDAGRNMSCTGVVIHIGDRGSATIVETRIGGSSDFGGSNTRTTIALGNEAGLDHIVLQDAPMTQIHLSRVEVTQGSGSEFRARSFNFGASYGRMGYDVHLDGEGACADLSGLYYGLGNQTLDQQITVVHGAEDCTSRQSFRGVLDDGSTGVFNGGIDVRPGADGTDASQSNDNLLLSTRAEVNTQPRLEILADDVACKHGATVGQLDETALYYLRSRGIGLEEARRLLISAFAVQGLDDVEIEVVRSWISERLGHDNA